jgi:hypothetical protein
MRMSAPTVSRMAAINGPSAEACSISLWQIYGQSDRRTMTVSQPDKMRAMGRLSFDVDNA